MRHRQARSVSPVRVRRIFLAGLLASLFGTAAAGALAADAPPEAPAEPARTVTPMELLSSLAGTWDGTARTWFRPGELADESKVSGTITLGLDGLFVRHVYEGTMQGTPRRGEEMIAYNSVRNVFQVAWMDSFHMSYAIMFSEGELTESGFSVTGTYDTGPGLTPWSWRTTYELTAPDVLTITAYNVSPDGQEAKAVETVYTRRQAGSE